MGTTRVDSKTVLRNLGRSAVATGEPSLQTRNVLFEYGLFEAFDNDPEAAIAELHRTMVASQGNEDQLFALAELSLLHGQAATKPDYYLAAAVYAYAFLFPERAGSAAPGRFDPRVRIAADLYNWTLTTAFTSKDTSEVVPRGGSFMLPFGQNSLILQWDENLDISSDTGTPVDDKDYQVPFTFTGKLIKLTLSIDRPKLTPADEKRLMEAQRNNKVSE